MPAGQEAGRGFLPELVEKLRLRKSSLLRKGWEFERVYSRGNRLHGDGFTLICEPNFSDHSRLGISVHRKIRGAVKRNRIKRIIRESFRLYREQYPQSMDIVFAVRPGFSLAHPRDIISVVALLARRIANTHEG
jgi:ribonuclease P protein component